MEEQQQQKGTEMKEKKKKRAAAILHRRSINGRDAAAFRPFSFFVFFLFVFFFLFCRLSRLILFYRRPPPNRDGRVYFTIIRGLLINVHFRPRLGPFDAIGPFQDSPRISSGCFHQVHRVLPGCTGFSRVLPGFTGFYRV